MMVVHREGWFLHIYAYVSSFWKPCEWMDIVSAGVLFFLFKRTQMSI